MARIVNSISERDYRKAWDHLQASLKSDVIDAAVSLTRVPRSIVALSFFEWVDSDPSEIARETRNYFTNKDRDTKSKHSIELIEWAVVDFSNGATNPTNRSSRRTTVWRLLCEMAAMRGVRLPPFPAERKRRASMVERTPDLVVGRFNVTDFLKDTTPKKKKYAIEFFAWVHGDENEAATKIRGILLGSQSEMQTPVSRDAVIQAFQVWETTQVNKDRSIAQKYSRSGEVIRAIVAAGESDAQHFPAVTRASLSRVSAHKADHSAAIRLSLAEAGWAEFRGKSEKECHALALEMLTEDARKIFDFEEDLFKVGRMAISGQRRPDEVSGDFWRSLTHVLMAEQDSYDATGRSHFCGKWPAETMEAVGKLTNVADWRCFVPFQYPKMQISNVLVQRLITSCLGPSLRATQAVKAMVAFQTGWNKQCVAALPLNPYAFATDEGVRIATEGVLASFKGRADHFVFAPAGGLSTLTGIRAKNVEALWDQTWPDFEQNMEEAHATISASGTLIDILLRYEKMSAAVRDWCRPTLRNNFFVSISANSKTGPFDQRREIRDGIDCRYHPSGSLLRPGVSYKAVRRSFLKLLNKSGLRSEEIRINAGHHSRGVLEQNYLTGPEARADAEKAIRFFQSCLQALITQEGFVLNTKMSKDNRTWFAHLANITGVAAACGMAPQVAQGHDAPTFKFTTSRDELLDLYLTHRALKIRSRELSQPQWMAQGRPVMAWLLAIYRTLFENGHRAAYKAAAREGRALLSSGTVSLPVVLEF